jgi:hypothetical protein
MQKFMTQLLQCNLACGLEIVVELELLLLEIVNMFFHNYHHHYYSFRAVLLKFWQSLTTS